MRLADRIFNAFEGVGMAVDSLRANKVRAALTIMGVAIGVFVVVAMSSVVRGINESFARDLEAAGPTSFFIYRRPIGGFQACDGSDETCPERRNPALTIDELINIIPGPDFPTGGIILGRQGIRSAYHLGRGSIVMRGRCRSRPCARTVKRSSFRKFPTR